MRIIAGSAKGRNLQSPSGATRPTSDRAREALFSSLGSEFGSMADLYFLDLYTGSGAVACEALSRGASLVHGVDSDDEVVKIARGNLAIFEKISGSGTHQVFTSPVQRFLQASQGIAYDIVFIDPPYDLANSAIEKDLAGLLAGGFIKESSVVAIERDSKSVPFTWPSGLAQVKVRKYGHAVIYYGAMSAKMA